MSADFIYDNVPYPSYTFGQTHPDRLATAARLRGMKPARAESCRVLELGCGDGCNLLSFAALLTASDFTGVDLSERHVAAARQSARELELQNATFEQRDILEIKVSDYGQFDFIIAHGVYSWVPQPVREKILQLYRELLKPHGVGYISYNAYPGFHIRELLREMMQFHIASFDDPAQKINQAVGLVKFLHEVAEPNSFYQNLLSCELKNILARQPENLFHDDISEFNQPFYFHEFIRAAERAGLQYLDETDYFSLYTLNFSPEIKQTIDMLAGGELVKREQYVDFVKCRRFRQTLVCHGEIALNQKVESNDLNEIYFVSTIRPASESPEIAEPKAENFVAPSGAAVEIAHPPTKAALIHLAGAAPQAVRFDELLRHTKSILTKENYLIEDFGEDARTIADSLMKIAGAGLLKLQTYARPFAVEPGERPLVSRFARWQAARGSRTVTTITGSNLPLDDGFVSALLPVLDGTRDRRALLDELAARIETGELAAEGADKQAVVAALPDLLEHYLSKIAAAALLLR